MDCSLMTTRSPVTTVLMRILHYSRNSFRRLPQSTLTKYLGPIAHPLLSFTPPLSPKPSARLSSASTVSHPHFPLFPLPLYLFLVICHSLSHSFLSGLLSPSSLLSLFFLPSLSHCLIPFSILPQPHPRSHFLTLLLPLYLLTSLSHFLISATVFPQPHAQGTSHFPLPHPHSHLSIAIFFSPSLISPTVLPQPHPHI